MPKGPKKKKNALPSGSYRLQVFDYKDADGKRHYKSFTAPTKKEAEYLAAQWKASREENTETAGNITIHKALNRYVDMKRAVLSPSTVRGYEKLIRNYFLGDFGKLKLYEVTNAEVQVWISGIASNLSPKTVRNAYGLLSATLDLFRPDFHPKITLPQSRRPELYCPSDRDVKRLLAHIQGSDLEIAVLLAAFGPLRRGEICALTRDDIQGNKVIVRHSKVKGPDKEWYIKAPKTPGSQRTVEFPAFVIERLKDCQGPVVHMNPDQITHHFGRTLKQINVPHFRFHDLRHYAASIMHAIGVPDQYILQRGGWSSDNVMKTVYRNVIDMEAARQTKKINAHFERMQHEMQHDTRRAL